MHEINTTPLIDVMLVLLVMLIVTIPIQLHAVRLALPVGVAPQGPLPPKVHIDIDAASVIHWQGEPVTAAELEARLAQLATQNPQPQVHVRPDKAARYAAFAQVLASTRRQGLAQVAVIGAEQFAP
ncbi:MAG: biopolymer transporter ExbD [Rhodoferax sp.]